jgi:hypothetical protein
MIMAAKKTSTAKTSKPVKPSLPGVTVPKNKAQYDKMRVTEQKVNARVREKLKDVPQPVPADKLNKIIADARREVTSK